MDVVVKSRHCVLPESFRTYVDEKILRLEKLDDRIIRVDVEVSQERNKRQHDQASCVEITLHTKGPVVRAEAAAEEKTAAFDMAIDKLMARLRRAADRKRVHRGQHNPRSLHEAAAYVPAGPSAAGPGDGGSEGPEDEGTHTIAGMAVQGEGPMVVREKVHAAVPMSLDQALLEMELVGHDFYLFIDATEGAPSVVYRRRAYDYGVIRLSTAEHLAAV